MIQSLLEVRVASGGKGRLTSIIGRFYFLVSVCVKLFEGEEWQIEGLVS